MVFKKGQIAWNKGKKNVNGNCGAPKGIIPWNKGKYHTQITKDKISKKNKGKHHSINTEFKKEILPWNKGKKGIMKDVIKKMNIIRKLKGKDKPNLGKHHIKETLDKISKKAKERFKDITKHPSWLGGISFEPYGIEFNTKLKEKIRKRDNFRCQECFRHQDELFTKKGKKYKLNIHHIDFCKTNNNPNNLISLCKSCHIQTNYNRENWTKYFQEKINVK